MERSKRERRREARGSQSSEISGNFRVSVSAASSDNTELKGPMGASSHSPAASVTHRRLNFLYQFAALSPPPHWRWTVYPSSRESRSGSDPQGRRARVSVALVPGGSAAPSRTERPLTKKMGRIVIRDAAAKDFLCRKCNAIDQKTKMVTGNLFVSRVRANPTFAKPARD